MRQRTEPKLRLSEIGYTNAVHWHSDAQYKVIKVALRGAEEALLCLPASAVTLRKKSANEVRRYKIALAPHKKLPADIWLHIFQLCSELGRGALSLSPLQVLPQVCSGWRRILMACPAFWSNVCTDTSPYALSRARIWLSRAENLPRSLRIVGGGYGRGLDEVQQILSLIPFETRITLPYWRSDELATPSLKLSKIPIELLLPLEELILDAGERWSGQSRFPQITSFSSRSMPNLTSLVIGEPLIFPIFKGPWPKLRKLVLHCPLPTSVCLSILRDAVGVEECSMFVRSHWHWQAGSRTNSAREGIVLPNLAALKLRFRPARNAKPFLDTLTLPNLTSLNLGNAAGGDGGCDEATLCRLAKRSGLKKMETLMISNTAASLDIGTLLEILPSLCHLEILTGIAELNISTMDRIGSGSLGSRLRVLHLRGYVYLPSLLSMSELRQRQLGCPKIQIFVEAYPLPVGENEKWRIRQLSNGGMEFKVKREGGCLGC